MSIRYEYGDLLESHCEYICHQVNCMGAMNSGIAKQIREKYPKVYEEYKKWQKTYQERTDYGAVHYYKMLGEILIVDCVQYKVINMAAQYNYGYDKGRYTSYDAFWNCLNQIKYCLPKGSKIGFPYGIGCGLGGANWYVINYMIKIILEEDFEVYIYQLPWCGDNLILNRISNLKKALSELDINLYNFEGNIKNTETILKELSNKWDILTEEQKSFFEKELGVIKYD